MKAQASSASLEAALGYLRRGRSILPLGADKRPVVVAPGQRFAWEEFQHRLPTEGEVRGWYHQYPVAGIGIVCGAISHLAVLDVDPRNGGNESLDKLVAQGHLFPDTPVAKTGGGGTHFYFSTATSVATRPALWPGIDLKGEGSYVVAPPSGHPSGGLYAWVVPPEDAQLAPLPTWLFEQAQKQATATPFTLPQAITKGERNDTLFRLACAMRAKGMELPGILAALMAENVVKCQPPLLDQEVETIAKSVLRYPPGYGTQKSPVPKPRAHRRIPTFTVEDEP